MKILRSLWFYGVLFFSTVLMGPAAAVAGLVLSKQCWAHLLGRLWGNLNLRTAGVSVTVYGLERIDREKPYVFVANHQSTFDIFAILGRLPVQFRWLAKQELFAVPVLGLAMRGIGHIPIDRRDRRKAVESLNAAADQVRAGTSIVVFPEGTRSRDGVLQDFKRGGFVLATKSKQPIVPISISGSHKILPKRGDWVVNPGHITMTISDPIRTDMSSPRDRGILIGRVRDAIRLHLKSTEGGLAADSLGQQRATP